jgi:hypothetical protein
MPAPPELAPIPEPPPTVDSGTLGDYASRAARGGLSATDRAALEALPPSDTNYSRAYTLLYQDAKNRGDHASRRVYLDKLLAQPENQYHPELLAEAAELAFERKDYDGALKYSSRAEQYWARLPPDLVFSRKALIYEIEGAAWTSKFYASEGADPTSLANAIQSWEKYKTHVASQPQQGLAARADEQLALLHDAQQRLP